MKKLIYAIALGGLTFASCSNTPEYKISGTAEGLADGTFVYLQKIENRKPVTLDSAKVEKGAFFFVGRQDTAAVRFLAYGKKYSSEFFLENGNITVQLGENEKIGGTPDNDALQNYYSKRKNLNDEMNSLYAQYKSTEDTKLRDSLSLVLDAKEEDYNDFLKGTITQSVNSRLGVYLLTRNSYKYDAATLRTWLNQIPAELKDEAVAQLDGYVKSLEATAVGQKFVDFTMKDPEGKDVKLSDFIKENKYTLIDFWASWCGPCRREMPSVVAAYKAFHKKGFGIVGVSLDTDAEQWKKALESMNMEWDQMSDLKGWECEGAKLYGVRSIPSTVLVDQDGTIIERNLRGDAIQAKLKELLK